jgi:hypothetical protein
MGATPENLPQQSSDSLRRNYDSSFAKYQKDSFNPKRTVSYLKPLLSRVAISVTKALNDPRAKIKIHGKALWLLVLPSGQIKRGGFADYPRPDSGMLKDTCRFFNYYGADTVLNPFIDTVVARYKTDSIPDYKPFLGIKGLIRGDSSKYLFSFADTSYYTNCFTGGRSRASIMRVVLEKIGDLRMAYNRMLRNRRSLNGKITVKFAINEYGTVIAAETVQPGTTIGDIPLQKEFVTIIKTWKFARILKPGDITEVVYPFVLSQ